MLAERHDMQIYQILIPELNTNVKFKVLSVSDIEDFLKKNKATSKDFRKKVLQYVVFNLATDVTSALNLMSREGGERAIEALYSGCIMLNPGLDIEHWLSIAYVSGGSPSSSDEHNDYNINQIKKFLRSAQDQQRSGKKTEKIPYKSKKITKQKFLNLESHLKANVIGQDEAVDEIVSALVRSQADMNDPDRPLGVFLFAGSSGVGKTHLANTLHRYLFGEESPMVRVDCGEYQHKHENQKLLGSPPGYLGHDEGGQLTNQIKKNPHTVVLIDEVEKAHSDIWNTFLRIFDDGIVTDSKGETISFRNTIIIMTTNLGNDKTVNHMISTGTGFNKNINFSRRTKEIPNRSIVEKNTNEAIDKYFRPEFINRLDKIVVFNYLNEKDCQTIAEIEMSVIANKLSKRGISITYTDSVIDALIEKGIDTVKGARGISQVRREIIETPIAKSIVNSSLPKGTIFYVDYVNDDFIFDYQKPVRKNTARDKEA